MSLTQLYRVMRLMAILLTVCCMQVTAKSWSQRITFSGQQVPLQRILKVVEEQTGTLSIYDAQILQSSRPVTITSEDQPLEEFLIAVFRDQPITFSLRQNTIVLRKKESQRKEATVVMDITGVVTNAQGEYLSGVNIIVKRTGRGVTSDAKGNFTLKNINGDDVLVISMVGYKTQEIAVGNKTDFVIVMLIDADGLDKVVIKGYSNTSEKLRTGNITTITAKEIETQPVVNPLQALQGRVAGLDINQTSGYASAPFKIEIRGRNTINASFPTDPLFIIDGVPLTILESEQNGSGANGSVGFLQNKKLIGPAGGQSPLFSINPGDIESITVLKDADATAIYGSRGANGVILITTKSGRAGKTNFDFSITQGIQKVTRRYALLNRQEYLQMRMEALKNDDYLQYLTPDFADFFYDLMRWDTTRYTDYQDYLWGNMGKTTDAQIDLTGGDQQTNYRIGVGIDYLTDITTAKGDTKRGSLNFTLSHKSIDQKLRLSFTNYYSVASTDLVNLTGMVLASPNSPEIFVGNGSLNWQGWQPKSQALTEYSKLLQPYKATTYFLRTSGRLEYELVKGLTLSNNIGYLNATVNQKELMPIASQNPAQNPLGEAKFGNNSSITWNVQPQITYNVMINRAKVQVLAGASYQGTTQDGNFVVGSGYVNDNLLNSIANAPVKDADDAYLRYKYASLFGQANVNWRDKYIVNASVRRDGSSRFGPGKQFGNFGSVGAAWIFSDEPWLKNNLRFLSLGKLRGSYGTTGSDIIYDYGYLTRWSGTNVVPYQNQSSYEPLQHANPDYQWQEDRKLEAALALGFLQNRLNMEVSWYRNRCDNQLVRFPLPVMSGFTFVAGNWDAKVENAGYEVVMSATMIDRPGLQWSARLNFSKNRNRLLSYPGLDKTPYANDLSVGQSVNLVNVLHYIGVDPQTGEHMYEDKNKDGQISALPGANSDFYFLERSPKFYGGFGTDLTYKNWRLDLYFTAKKQIGANAFFTTVTPGGPVNQPREVLNRWQKPGDHAQFARFTTNPQQSDFLLTSSDAAYTDASFVRLSNVSLSYNLPDKWMHIARIKSCSVYVHAQNLYVFTGYKGLDPETQNFGSMPPAKTVTGGLQLTF